MCEECRQSPCHPLCPNSPEPRAVFVCSGCGQDIYEGEDYWEFLGEQFCENCKDEARRVAEYDDSY